MYFGYAWYVLASSQGKFLLYDRVWQVVTLTDRFLSVSGAFIHFWLASSYCVNHGWTYIPLRLPVFCLTFDWFPAFLRPLFMFFKNKQTPQLQLKLSQPQFHLPKTRCTVNMHNECHHSKRPWSLVKSKTWYVNCWVIQTVELAVETKPVFVSAWKHAHVCWKTGHFGDWQAVALIGSKHAYHHGSQIRWLLVLNRKQKHLY